MYIILHDAKRNRRAIHITLQFAPESAELSGKIFETLIHPFTSISASAPIGEGCAGWSDCGWESGAVFDLLCTGPGGEKFIIEVQRARQKNFRKRAVFYTSRLISNQAPKGNRAAWGYDISEVYLIALLDGFTVTDPGDARYLHDVRLCERETGVVFYEELGYTYIELQKFHKGEDELEDDLDRWLFVLKNMARLEKIPVYLRKTIFEKVFNLAAYSKLSREERMAYDTSLKRKWDEFSIKETAFEDGFDKGKLEGKEEGIEEGADKKARAIARELLKEGLPVDLIARTTGLSREEIEQL